MPAKIKRSKLEFHTSYFKVFTSYLIGVLLPILLLGSVKAQGTGGVAVRKKLTISDFKGVPDETVDYLAKTNPVISLTYYGGPDCTEPGKIRLIVETRISMSDKSWIKASRIKNPDLLNALLSHEQGHYDLGEVFAINLKRTLSAICFDKKTVKVQVDSIYKGMFATYDALQRRYDTETGYMRNREMQSKWKQKIAAMLKE